jgi:hypothetical protein
MHIQIHNRVVLFLLNLFASACCKAITVILVLTSLSCGTAKKTVPVDSSPTIVSRSGWNAADPKPYKQHTPVRITVHHEGTKLLPTADAAKKIHNIQKWGMGPDRNWSDIPYHFLIAPNGTIYEGRDIKTVGETNTEYDPAGHLLICCLGNLDEQEVSKEQLTSLITLIAHVSKKYQIPAETLSTHKDNSKQTNCPGKNLYKYFQEGYIKTEVEKILKN